MADTKKLAKNANKIINNAKKMASGNKSLQGAWIEENGKQYVCDSHRILEINNPIELPMADTATHIKTYKMIEDAKHGDTYELKISSLEEIKEQMQLLKDKKKNGQRILVSLGKGQPTVNAEYLFQMSEALGGINTVYVNKEKPTKYPLYMENEIGTALLLPCNNPDNREGYWLCNWGGKYNAKI